QLRNQIHSLAQLNLFGCASEVRITGGCAVGSVLICYAVGGRMQYPPEKQTTYNRESGEGDGQNDE
ncbi:MAG: hypothetical protein ACI4RA_04095, partial [Kiritimatiellia bacterium]